MTWRPPTRDDRRVAALWAICAILGIALRPIWLRMAPLLPECPWHHWTGIACPGCGTTRAALLLLHLDLPGSLAMNPLACAAALGFVAGGVVAPVWLAFGGAVPEPSPGPKWGWGLVLAATVGLNWAWLVATGI